jgi:CSLREA domain-containing protein
MFLRSRAAVFSLHLFAMVFVVLLVQPVWSAVFVVDDTADAVDASLGDGSCAASGGTCTLRAAIQEANWFPDDDTIMLPAGTFAITIPAESVFEPSDANGSFYLQSTIDIIGAGNDVTILDGSEFSRVIDVSSSGVATLSDLTIQNGSRAGVAINQGSLTLYGVVLQDNFGTELPEPGGIKSESATLSLIESTVQRNTGANATGGILFTGGTFSAVDSVIRDNTGGMGIASGGMICNFGTATFERTAMIGNQGLSGAALLVMSGCDATLTNVTLSGNVAVSSQSAGALDNFGGTVTLVNVTVTENAAFGVTGAMTVSNSIIAGNGNFDHQQCITGGALVSLGHNIDTGTSCTFDGETDFENTDPDLGELDESGSSPVHSLLADSRAIDAIPLDDCVDSDDSPLVADQLGVARPQGSACDIGAVEFAPEPTAAIGHAAGLGAIGVLLCHGRRERRRARSRGLDFCSA